MSYSPSIIRRIQRGDVAVSIGNLTGTSTLPNSVNTAKATLNFLGQKDAGGSDASSIQIVLTNATTVTATRTGTATNATVSYEVVEFF